MRGLAGGGRRLETSLLLRDSGKSADRELDNFARFLRGRGACDVRVRRAATLRSLDYEVGGASRAVDATVAYLEPEGGNLIQEVQRCLAGRREGVLGFLTEQPYGALSFQALGGGRPGPAGSPRGAGTPEPTSGAGKPVKRGEEGGASRSAVGVARTRRGIEHAGA